MVVGPKQTEAGSESGFDGGRHDKTTNKRDEREAQEKQKRRSHSRNCKERNKTDQEMETR